MSGGNNLLASVFPNAYTATTTTAALLSDRLYSGFFQTLQQQQLDFEQTICAVCNSI
jgi:hypothetical protein